MTAVQPAWLFIQLSPTVDWACHALASTHACVVPACGIGRSHTKTASFDVDLYGSAHC